MVGRLVQKNDIRFGQQKLSEGDTGLLAAGERFDLFAKVLFVESQTFQDSGQLTAVGIAVPPLEFGTHTVVGFQKQGQGVSLERFHFMFHLTDVFFQFDQVAFYLKQFLVDGIAGGYCLVLRQIADGFSFCDHHFSGVGAYLAHDDFQKRRFPGSIDSHDGGLFPILNMERSVFQDFIGSEGFCYILTC